MQNIYIVREFLRMPCPISEHIINIQYSLAHTSILDICVRLVSHLESLKELDALLSVSGIMGEVVKTTHSKSV